jgi:hypothetical protein
MCHHTEIRDDWLEERTAGESTDEPAEESVERPREESTDRSTEEESDHSEETAEEVILP